MRGGLLFVTVASLWPCMSVHGVTLDTVSGALNRLSLGVWENQLNLEQIVRAEGGTGVKQVRHNSGGTRSYDSPNEASHSFSSMHEHGEHIRTEGLGEIALVINGIDFKTRHNDFSLQMPSTTSQDYKATEDLPFPEVPPAVLNLPTVEQQVAEMQEWHKAILNEDPSVRNYTEYFKPILCYIEAYWSTNVDTVEEPFPSDRHSITQDSWQELQDYIRFLAYTGRKDNEENHAFLPTSIYKVENCVPHLAQWNYRILCHPLDSFVHPNRFRVEDNLASRMAKDRTPEEHAMSRAANFRLNAVDSDVWTESDGGPMFLDDLMAGVPGLNNYNGNMIDDAFGEVAKNADGSIQNVAYYHRFFNTDTADCAGNKRKLRGMNDNGVFMAMTNHPEVAPITMEYNGVNYTQRWTFACPLEITYLSPVQSWNPYGLEYKGDADSPEGQTVTANGRNGATQATAYNGTNSKKYFLTPASFFSVDHYEEVTADTPKGKSWVRQPDGNTVEVASSGPKIFLDIDGLKPLRLRRPIMPVHSQGGTLRKEIEAVKEAVFNPDKHAHHFNNGNVFGRADTSDTLRLEMLPNFSNNHSHWVFVTAGEVAACMTGNTIHVRTEEALDWSGAALDPESNHVHMAHIDLDVTPGGQMRFHANSCDDKTTCGHGKWMDIEPVQQSP